MTQAIELHSKLKDLLFSDPSWDPMFIFGLRQPRRTFSASSNSEFRANARRLNLVKRRIASLCHEVDFDIDIESPFIGRRPDFIVGRDSKISSSVATMLHSIYRRIDEEIKLLHKEVEQFNCQSKRIKPGRPKVPAFFSWWVLASLEAHRESAQGLVLLKDFLEPNGELEDWLVSVVKDGDLLNQILKVLVVATGDSEFIFEWARTKRQSTLRSLVSSMRGRDVKRFGDPDKSLVEEIVLEANLIVKSLH